jgi:hypothetical protein
MQVVLGMTSYPRLRTNPTVDTRTCRFRRQKAHRPRRPRSPIDPQYRPRGSRCCDPRRSGEVALRPSRLRAPRERHLKGRPAQASPQPHPADTNRRTLRGCVSLRSRRWPCSHFRSHPHAKSPAVQGWGSTATGIRTRVSAVRGRRPSPLDDSGRDAGGRRDRTPTVQR